MSEQSFKQLQYFLRRSLDLFDQSALQGCFFQKLSCFYGTILTIVVIWKSRYDISFSLTIFLYHTIILANGPVSLITGKKQSKSK